jgi:hypothetical protein
VRARRQQHTTVAARQASTKSCTGGSTRRKGRGGTRAPAVAERLLGTVGAELARSKVLPRISLFRVRGGDGHEEYAQEGQSVAGYCSIDEQLSANARKRSVLRAYLRNGRSFLYM